MAISLTRKLLQTIAVNYFSTKIPKPKNDKRKYTMNFRFKGTDFNFNLKDQIITTFITAILIGGGYFVYFNKCKCICECIVKIQECEKCKKKNQRINY